ncbi:MAG: hypothetical protein WCR24_07155 [Candidatus Methanomethylophilaceae archaeon]
MQIDILTSLLVMGVVCIFAFIGAKVQRATKFILPIDVFSLMLFILCGLDVFVLDDQTPWSIQYWLFVIGGYFIGYLASSRKEFFNLIDVHLGTSSIDIPYIMPYRHDGKQYIQVQKNRELLKRLIFGIENEVETNGELKAKWQVKISHPYYPVPPLDAIPVETAINEPPTLVRTDKLIKCKQYRTKIIIAPAGMCTKLDMIAKEDAHELDIKTNIGLRNQLLRTKETVYRETMNDASRSIQDALYDSKPGVQLHEYLEKEKTAQTQNVNVQEVKRRLFSRHKKEDVE